MSPHNDESQSLIGNTDGIRRWWQLLGYLFAIVNGLFFPISGGTSQALGDVVPFCQLTVFRYTTMLIFSGITSRICMLDLRSIFQKPIIFFAMAYVVLDLTQLTGLYTALDYLSFTTISCLKLTVEVGTAFLATCILKRIFSVPQALSAGFCVVGVFLLTQPEFLFGDMSNHEHATRSLCGKLSHKVDHIKENMYTNQSMYVANETFLNYVPSNTSMTPSTGADSAVYPGYLLACLCGMVQGTMFFIGSNKLNNINVLVVVFWGSLFNSGIMIVAMLISEQPAFPSGPTCISLLFGHLGAVAINHISFTAAALIVPPIMMAIMCSLELVVGLCAQYTVLKHINPGHGNALEVIGAVVVMLGNIVGPFYQMFKLRQKAVEREKEVIGEMNISGE